MAARLRTMLKAKFLAVATETADVTVAIPECETYKVQEIHMPVYHASCAWAEETLA